MFSKTASNLKIHESKAIVTVRIINTNTLLYINTKLFVQPQIKGFNGCHAPIYCFLISHGQRHVIFDLGVRKDWDNYAPKIVTLIKATTTVTEGEHDVAGVLDTDTSGLNIRSKDIESIVWSHNHFDHIGDPSTFPLSTNLIVGPGVQAASWPGYPSNPDGGLLDSDIDGRTVHEIAFDPEDEHYLKIGRFDAFDFFGDGSFYLLDAPGHAVGHLCALARTTASPPSFVLLGADACHHPGALRPTNYLPLPDTILFPHSHTGLQACPGEFLQQLTINQSASNPFFNVAKGPLFPDHDAALDTVEKIQELDSSDEVFVLIAHDLSLLGKIPLFPETINGWRERGLGISTRWLFCEEFENSLKKLV